VDDNSDDNGDDDNAVDDNDDDNVVDDNDDDNGDDDNAVDDNDDDNDDNGDDDNAVDDNDDDNDDNGDDDNAVDDDDDDGDDRECDLQRISTLIFDFDGFCKATCDDIFCGGFWNRNSFCWCCCSTSDKFRSEKTDSLEFSIWWKFRPLILRELFEKLGDVVDEGESEFEGGDCNESCGNSEGIWEDREGICEGVIWNLSSKDEGW